MTIRKGSNVNVNAALNMKQCAHSSDREGTVCLKCRE